MFLLRIFISLICLTSIALSSNEDSAIIDSVNKANEYWYQDDAKALKPELTFLRNNCYESLPFNDYLTCKTFLLDFDWFYEYEYEKLDKLLFEFKNLFNQLELNPLKSESSINFLERFLQIVYFYDVEYEEFSKKIVKLFNEIKPLSNNPNYAYRWNDLGALISYEEGKFTDEEKYLRASIIFAEEIFNSKSWELNSLKIRLAYSVMNQGDLDKSRFIAASLIDEISIEEDAENHLKAWEVLERSESLLGNEDDRFYYLRIFIEKYIYATKKLGLKDFNLDQFYLSNVGNYFNLLTDCESYRYSLEDYEYLKARRQKTAENYKDSLNIPAENFEAKNFHAELAIKLSNLECLKDVKFFDKTLLEFKDLLDEYIELTESYEYGDLAFSANLIYSAFGDYEKFQIKSEDLIDLHKKILSKLFYSLEVIEDYSYINQFSAEFIVDILVLWLPELSEDERKKNFSYIDKILFNLFSKEKKYQITSAYQNLLFSSTYWLYTQGYEDKAIHNYISYFSKSDFSKGIYKSKTFDDLEQMERDILLMTLLSQENQKIDPNNALNILNRIDRNILELALFIEDKTLQGDIIKFLENEVQRNRNRNEYFASFFSYEGESNESLRSSEKSIKEFFSQASLLDERKFEIFYSKLYPSLNLKDIQKKLSKDEAIFGLFMLDYGMGDRFIKLIISKKHFLVNVIDEVEIFSTDKFYELMDLTKGSFSASALEKLKQESNEISNYLFKKDELDISKFKEISFISNFFNVFNPSILRHNDSWLVESVDIKNYLSLSDFFLRNQNGSIEQNYLAFADMDYKEHDVFYPSLSETRDEINESSKFFENKSLFTKNRATVSNLLRSDTQNSVIHIATHNTFIPKSGFIELPALVFTKTDNEDGYLDAIEIQDLILKNSNVILSACETFSEIETESEPFSGLVKSFILAGAQSVMATRWEIESISASRFVSSYIGEISTSQNQSKAISKVQRSFIGSDDYSSPFYWAPYLSFEN